MKPNNLCPCCEEGSLSPVSKLRNYIYKGYRTSYIFNLLVCDTCYSEVCGEKEADMNLNSINNCKQKIDDYILENWESVL